MAILISQPAAIRKEDLDALGPVKMPLSSPAAQLVGRKFLNDVPGIDSMGIWECSPGRWQRTIMEEEFAHFICGSARFVPDEGAPIDIKAGDTIWFPANSRGVWEISEDVRKVYVIIDRPGILKILKTRIKALLAAWGFRPDAPSAAMRAPEPFAAFERCSAPRDLGKQGSR